ncbi:MAG: Rrf2 family transcriptional regulator [Bacteroidota bacterium]|nr:Rrf2 family transcriptional regulator [Bacteroidota bacterium]
MTVIFSKKCEYGLQAILFLSSKTRGERVSADEIASKLNIPKEFVSKILQSLTGSNIAASKKGKSGGFYIAKDPSQIKLLDVVKAIDGLDVFDNCVLGFPHCSKDNPCPLHNKWGKLREDAYNMLNDETIDKFYEKTVNKINSL